MTPKVGLFLALVVVISMKVFGALIISVLLIIPAAVVRKLPIIPEEMVVLASLSVCCQHARGNGRFFYLRQSYKANYCFIGSSFFMMSKKF
jgi:ABC-type Mn2+/Zn2+ transport system permease subunit